MDPEPYRCNRPFPLLVRVPLPSQALLTPRYNSFCVLLPAFRARGTHPLTHLSLSFSPSRLLVSLRDCEPASDLKHYPSNSHSVEIFDRPDGLVNECLIANSYNHICTLFPAVSRLYWYSLYDPSSDYPPSNWYPSGPAFATGFHACVVRPPISNAPSLPS